MTGLRGVGKTVLLNEIRRKAIEQGYKEALIEAPDGKSLSDMLVSPLKSILFELDRMQGVSEKVKRGLRVLRGWLGTPQVTMNDVTFGIAYDPEVGVADSGDLEVDLPALFVAVGEAARDRGTGVALLIDEVQYLASKELAALIVAMHRIQQEQLPVVLVGTGLPTIPALAGNAKSYAERLFSYPVIGALSREDSDLAITEPLSAQGVAIDADALEALYEWTKGYPYFLQEWGYQCWNVAADKRIDRADVLRATERVRPRLDESFFRVRYDRLTPSEKRFLRAMAELGPGPHKTGDIADGLGQKTSSLGPVRANLINKGMIYSPSFGEMAFTVPLFDEFMKRAIPQMT